MNDAAETPATVDPAQTGILSAPATFNRVGKAIYIGAEHLADCATEEAADFILSALKTIGAPTTDDAKEQRQRFGRLVSTIIPVEQTAELVEWPNE